MEIPAFLRTRAREWARWSGWRRHGPAAGSVFLHIGVAAVVATMVGVAGASDPPVSPKPPETLQLILIPEVLPEPGPKAGVTPPRAPAPRPVPAPRNAGDLEEPSSIPDPRKKRETPAPSPQPTESEPAVEYVPPSVLLPRRGPKGLESLAYGDPCERRFGEKPKECVDDWTARVGTMDSVMPRSKADLAQHFAEFVPKCPWKVGCEGGEWISTNGTRATPAKSPASGGAASLGGIHDVVGRLPQNPDFIDPGFGD